MMLGTSRPRMEAAVPRKREREASGDTLKTSVMETSSSFVQSAIVLFGYEIVMHGDER